MRKYWFRPPLTEDLAGYGNAPLPPSPDGPIPSARSPWPRGFFPSQPDSRITRRQLQMERLAGAVIEPRWPGAVAVASVGLLNLLLPAGLAAGPGWITVAVVAALAAATLVFRRWHDWFGHTAAAFATLQLALCVVALVGDLTGHKGVPSQILRAALVIWIMNVLVFASWYWRLDAGGPHHRSKHDCYRGGAFLFPQMTLSNEARRSLNAEDWRPGFIDYLFVAFNASTAFSPTDVPVLSAWAKVLMMTQASISLVTLVVVAARAVNIL